MLLAVVAQTGLTALLYAFDVALQDCRDNGPKSDGVPFPQWPHTLPSGVSVMLAGLAFLVVLLLLFGVELGV